MLSAAFVLAPVGGMAAAPMLVAQEQSSDLSSNDCLANGTKAVVIGDLDAAEKWFLKALALNSSSATARFNLGLLYEATDQVEASISHYEAYLRIGKEASRRNSAEYSLTRLKKAREMDSTPEGAKARRYFESLARARLFASIGEFNAAINHIVLATSIDDSRWEAYAATSSVQLQLRDFAGAAASLAEARTRADAASAPVIEKLQVMLNQELTIRQKLGDARERIARDDLNGAATELLTLLQESPDHQEGSLVLGQVRLMQGAFTEAKTALTTAALGDEAGLRKSAEALLVEVGLWLDFAEMMSDDEIQHPMLEAVESRLETLFREMGMHEQSIDLMQQTHEQMMDSVRQAAALGVNNDLGAGLAILTAISGQNEKNRLEQKLNEVNRLSNTRKELQAVDREIVVACHASSVGNHKLALLAFEVALGDSLSVDSAYEGYETRMYAYSLFVTGDSVKAERVYSSMGTIYFDDIEWLAQVYSTAQKPRVITNLLRDSGKDALKFLGPARGYKVLNSAHRSMIEAGNAPQLIGLYSEVDKQSKGLAAAKFGIARVHADTNKPKDSIKWCKETINFAAKKKYVIANEWFLLWIQQAEKLGDKKSVEEARKKAAELKISLD